MIQLLKDIEEFHKKFKSTIAPSPTYANDKHFLFGVGAMQEELAEYVAAHMKGDHAEELDALLDLIYFAVGVLYVRGYGPVLQRAWARIHAANMTKVMAKHADNSKRGYSLDVVKPEGFIPPDHSDLIKELYDNAFKKFQEIEHRETS